MGGPDIGRGDKWEVGIAREMKLLLVDDDAELLQLLLLQFKAFGFKLFSASSGLDALKILQADRPQIVVSDYRMKNGDGMMVLRHCKSRNPHEPKVFIISGFTDFDVAELYHEGADGFFSKPFSASELRTNVQRATLDRRLLWGGHLENLKNNLTVTLAGPEEFSEGSVFKMGRGGFLLRQPSVQFSVDSVVEIRFEVGAEGATKPMRIQARVIWIRHAPDPAYGLEILRADAQARDILSKLAAAPTLIPFIPKI